MAQIRPSAISFCACGAAAGRWSGRRGERQPRWRASTGWLPESALELQHGGEEGQHLGFETVRYAIDVVAIVDLEGVADSVAIQDLVELAHGACNRLVFVAGIHADGLVAFEICDVLIDLRQRRIGGPL